MKRQSNLERSAQNNLQNGFKTIKKNDGFCWTSLRQRQYAALSKFDG